jgi:hypothetical protein
MFSSKLFVYQRVIWEFTGNSRHFSWDPRRDATFYGSNQNKGDVNQFYGSIFLVVSRATNYVQQNDGLPHNQGMNHVQKWLCQISSSGIQ